MINDKFSAYLENQMSEEDDLDIMFSVSEDCFGAFDNIFSTDNFIISPFKNFLNYYKVNYLYKLYLIIFVRFIFNHPIY